LKPAEQTNFVIVRFKIIYWTEMGCLCDG